MILSDTPSSADMGTAVEETSRTSESTWTKMSVGDIDKLQSDHIALRMNRCLKGVITSRLGKHQMSNYLKVTTRK